MKDIIAITCTERPRTVLLADVAVTLPKSVRQAAESYGIEAEQDEHSRAVLSFVNPTFDGQDQRHFSWPQWPDGLYAGPPNPRQFATVFGAALTAFLTTARRLLLVEKGTLNGRNRGTLLQELYNGSKPTELSIRNQVKEAFPDVEIALDFTGAPAVESRVGADFSQLPDEIRAARVVLEKCERLDDQGDGLRSYAGVVTAMMCANRPVFLIDEPETFLHPPQAYRLGEFIASMASDTRQIIVATHSVDVLRGLVSAAKNLKVVRLDRVGNTTNFATLEDTEVRHLYSDPLLSSAGVLNGLFYSGVVVTEADGDARFYAALSAKMEPGRDLHFINADNKQTVPAVLNTYRKMGVRAAAILDIDVLNNAVEFGQQLEALGVAGEDKINAQAARERIEIEVNAPNLTALLSGISSRTAEIKSMVDRALVGDHAAHEIAIRKAKRSFGELRESASVWRRLKREGRAVLVTTVADFDFVASIFRTHGVFINCSGELEASLGERLPWRADKKSWFFDAMATIPNLVIDREVQPWRLMSEVHAFLDEAIETGRSDESGRKTSAEKGNDHQPPMPSNRQSDGGQPAIS